MRYHLKEWAKGRNKPQNIEELFNLRHSSLRNVIERSYGVLKNRFQILKNMRSYPYDIQVELVISAFILHNFIRKNQSLSDELDEDCTVVEEDFEEPEIAAPVNVANNIWRDAIAQEMCNDYVHYLS